MRVAALTQTATRFCSRLSYHDFNGPERDPDRTRRACPRSRCDELSDPAQSWPADGGTDSGRSLHGDVRARALLPDAGGDHGLQHRAQPHAGRHRAEIDRPLRPHRHPPLRAAGMARPAAQTRPPRSVLSGASGGASGLQHCVAMLAYLSPRTNRIPLHPLLRRLSAEDAEVAPRTPRRTARSSTSAYCAQPLRPPR
jgi:hypothetical protein